MFTAPGVSLPSGVINEKICKQLLLSLVMTLSSEEAQLHQNRCLRMKMVMIAWTSIHASSFLYHIMNRGWL